MKLVDLVDVLFELTSEGEEGVFASLHEYLDNMYFA